MAPGRFLLTGALAAAAGVGLGVQAWEFPGTGGDAPCSSCAAGVTNEAAQVGEFHSFAQTSWGRSRGLIDLEPATVPGRSRNSAIFLALRGVAALLMVFAVVVAYAGVSGVSSMPGGSVGGVPLLRGFYVSSLLPKTRANAEAPAATRQLREAPASSRSTTTKKGVAQQEGKIAGKISPRDTVSKKGTAQNEGKTTSKASPRGATSKKGTVQQEGKIAGKISPRGTVSKKGTAQNEGKIASRKSKLFHVKSLSAQVPEVHSLGVASAEAEAAAKGKKFHGTSLSAQVPEVHNLGGLASSEAKAPAKGQKFHATSLSALLATGEAKAAANGKRSRSTPPSAQVPEVHNSGGLGVGEAKAPAKGRTFHATSLSALIASGEAKAAAKGKKFYATSLSSLIASGTVNASAKLPASGEAKAPGKGKKFHATSLSALLASAEAKAPAGVQPDAGGNVGAWQWRSIGVKAKDVMESLRHRAQTHRNRRTVTGDKGLLEDDLDASRIEGFLDLAETRAHRQQYERAAHDLEKAAGRAEVWLRDLLGDGSEASELEDAYHLYGEAYSKLASFYLEHGHAQLARQALTNAAGTVQAMGGAPSWQVQLLLANAFRDEGKLDTAASTYESLLGELDEASTWRYDPASAATLPEIRALARGELARAELLQGRSEAAWALLKSAADGLRGESSAVTALLQGWLGAAELARGRPAEALTALNRALAGMVEAVPGLAAATPEVQEVLQARARAHVLMGDAGAAREDINVVQSLQEELLATVLSGHNPEFLKYDKKAVHPDLRLLGMMARSKLIDAEVKLAEASVGQGPAAHQRASAEALELVQGARQILLEAAEHGPLPLGSGVATLADADALAALAQQRADDVTASRQLP